MKQIKRVKIIDRDEWLINLAKGKSILHIGCTDYPITDTKIKNNNLLHQKLVNVAEEILGIDIDEEGLSRLRILMPNENFICYNAEKLNSCKELDGKIFDIVIAADVIEHISNVGLFLQSVSEFLHENSYLLITTPNAFSFKRFIPMFFLGYEYVHPDHTSYYSIATLERILTRYNLIIKDYKMFQWQNPTFKNWFANTLLSPILFLNGGRICDEIAVLIQKND